MTELIEQAAAARSDSSTQSQTLHRPGTVKRPRPLRTVQVKGHEKTPGTRTDRPEKKRLPGLARFWRQRPTHRVVPVHLNPQSFPSKWHRSPTDIRLGFGSALQNPRACHLNLSGKLTSDLDNSTSGTTPDSRQPSSGCTVYLPSD